MFKLLSFAGETLVGRYLSLIWRTLTHPVGLRFVVVELSCLALLVLTVSVWGRG